MIYNPFTNIPKQPRSHVRGWALHWAECLGTTVAGLDSRLDDHSTIYIEHGVNFGGVLNLFGGVTGQLVDRLDELVNYKGNLVSLDWPMPNYAHQLSLRIGQATCSPRLTQTLLDALEERLTRSITLTQRDLSVDHVTIGDSHSTAFAPVQSSVLRTNGLTLHGALQKGHFIGQMGRLVHQPKRVTLACGSIDIRHHIGRQADPKQALLGLCGNYSDLADFLADEYGVEVEIATPVPVEWEGRKIPQTGFYKKEPFSGTQAQRREWTQMFIDKMCEHGLISPPQGWYSMDGKEYADTYMEPNSSVHIAPPFYRRNDWGQL
jgi:hypothetical protein